MNRNILIGLIFGIIAGILDVIPMIVQNLPINADLSAFFMWVIVGILISVSEFKINKFIKGMIISLMVLLPNLFIIGWDKPASLIPIIIMTIILGCFLGYAIDKFSN